MSKNNITKIRIYIERIFFEEDYIQIFIKKNLHLRKILNLKLFYYQRNLKINSYWDGILVLEIISMFLILIKLINFNVLLTHYLEKIIKELFKYTLKYYNLATRNQKSFL